MASFFSEFKWISEKIIDEFIAEHKRKQYLKQSLKRLIGRGFIQKQNNKLNLTLEGLKFFKKRGLPSSIKTSKPKQNGDDGRNY